MTRIWDKLKKLFNFSLPIAKVEFKTKNEGSYLGILWYLINPLLVFTLLLFIFYDRLGGNIENYHLYLLLGIIIFDFFRTTTMESSTIIINNASAIKTINFPREILVFSLLLKNIASHFLEIVIFSLFLIMAKISLVGIILYLPVLFLLFIFVFGISLFLAAVTVYFKDLANIWNFVSYLLWFATPIFYAIEGQHRLFALNMANPMYYFITAARDIIIYIKMPALWIIAGMLGYALLSLLIGTFVFRKLKYKFAELI